MRRRVRLSKEMQDFFSQFLIKDAPFPRYSVLNFLNHGQPNKRSLSKTAKFSERHTACCIYKSMHSHSKSCLPIADTCVISLIVAIETHQTEKTHFALPSHRLISALPKLVSSIQQVLPHMFSSSHFSVSMHGVQLFPQKSRPRPLSERVKATWTIAWWLYINVLNDNGFPCISDGFLVKQFPCMLAHLQFIRHLPDD